jgi:transcription elongation factor Elf1
MTEEQKHGIGYDMSEVRIVKGPTIAVFKCAICGTEFEVPAYKCKRKMTGLNECHTVFNCPTCGKECWE